MYHTFKFFLQSALLFFPMIILYCLGFKRILNALWLENVLNYMSSNVLDELGPSRTLQRYNLFRKEASVFPSSQYITWGFDVFELILISGVCKQDGYFRIFKMAVWCGVDSTPQQSTEFICNGLHLSYILWKDSLLQSFEKCVIFFLDLPLKFVPFIPLTLARLLMTCQNITHAQNKGSVGQAVVSSGFILSKVLPKNILALS